MERQEGYYWVQLESHLKPSIAYFDGINWDDLESGRGCIFTQTWFHWKDKPENRLTPPNI